MIACLALVLAEQGDAGAWWIPLVLVGLIFYFIVIRPGSRERKQREAQLKALKKHDKVVTNAGIHGVVVALADDTVTIEVDDNVRIRFNRNAVWQVVAEPADERPAGREKA